MVVAVKMINETTMQLPGDSKSMLPKNFPLKSHPAQSNLDIESRAILDIAVQHP